MSIIHVETFYHIIKLLLNFAVELRGPFCNSYVSFIFYFLFLFLAKFFLFR